MSLVLVRFTWESLFCIDQMNIQRSMCLVFALIAVNVSVHVRGGGVSGRQECVCLCVCSTCGRVIHSEGLYRLVLMEAEISRRRMLVSVNSTLRLSDTHRFRHVSEQLLSVDRNRK